MHIHGESIMFFAHTAQASGNRYILRLLVMSTENHFVPIMNMYVLGGEHDAL